MRFKITFTIAALSLALVSGAATAQTPAPQQRPPVAQTTTPPKQFTPSHLAVARDVAVATGMTRSFDSVLDQVRDQVRSVFAGRPDQKLQEDLETVLKDLKPELDLQSVQMTNATIQVLASNLTEAELKDVDTFFKTPSGKKYVETQPKIMDSFVNEFSNWANNLRNYTLVRARAELAKKGHKL